jgi:hypothetical protein
MNDKMIIRIALAVVVMMSLVLLSNCVAKSQPAPQNNQSKDAGVEQTDQTLFPVQVDGKWGCISKTGKMVVEPQFTEIGHFSEGLASVKVGDKYGYIDITGKTVIEPQFDGAQNFADGLANVRVGNEGPLGQGGKWGYIDKTGTYVIQG